jgi:hypothetical protein
MTLGNRVVKSGFLARFYACSRASLQMISINLFFVLLLSFTVWYFTSVPISFPKVGYAKHCRNHSSSHGKTIPRYALCAKLLPSKSDIDLLPTKEKRIS